jgi:hypothetical protein
MVMTAQYLGTLFLLVSSLALCQTPAANPSQTPGATPPVVADDGRIYLDVVVDSKGGTPNAELQQRDFTLLDNKTQQPITSFRALGGASAPVKVVLMVDAVNTTYQVIAYERQQIDGFLKANGGHLAHPATTWITT